jgi:hypothetical protein
MFYYAMLCYAMHDIIALGGETRVDRDDGRDVGCCGRFTNRGHAKRRLETGIWQTHWGLMYWILVGLV